MTFTLRKINPNVLPAEVALWDAIPLLSGLMNDVAFLGSHVLPLVDETAEDWYVAHRHDSPDGSSPCKSSSGLRAPGPGSTTIPPGGFLLRGRVCARRALRAPR